MPPWQQQSMLHHLPSSTSAGVAGLPMLAGLRRAEQRSLVRLLSSSAAAAVARPASSSPQTRKRWTAAASASPMHPGALIARRLHTEQQQQQHSSSEGMPPPSSSSGKASSSSPSPPVYQSARPTPSSSSTSSPPATSDITRVTPVSLTPGGERGAAHNQESVALSQLAEKQAIEKAKQEAEEKRLREMGVVKRVWEKVK
ncbi:hypothetical protein BDZ90DRAFT_98810 [Jaminaea rosea]|uniref:Uncharacterized protein n=1 Tax=Jaminaea rosea TaxID=1569628 RepID=A0A316UKS8_9BASI|nr:hypothetical protein BDZ90DRAFT_98810 [Jaminaea rosea]PWN24533.1 hypothetical protein BDZ90DRAFT_98810 [Jaminaea rosea]